MRRILVGFVFLVVVGAAAFYAYNWTFGGPRVMRDAAAFSNAIDTCSEFAQDAYVPLGGIYLEQSVASGGGDLCTIQLQDAAGDFVTCNLTPDARRVFAQGVRDQAALVGFTGRPNRIVISTSAEDPYTELLNSPACTVGPK